MGWFKSSLLKISVSAMVLMLASGCGGSLEGTNTSSGATVRGKVLNTDGSGAPNILIEANEGNATTSSVDGSYELTKVPLTTRELIFTANGVQSTVPLEIPPGVETLVINFEVQDDGSVKQKGEENSDPAIEEGNSSSSTTISTKNEEDSGATNEPGKPKAESTPSSTPTPQTDILGVNLPDMSLSQLTSGEEPEALKLSNGGIATYTTAAGSLYQLSSGVENLIDSNVYAFEPSSDGSIVAYVSGNKEGTSFDLKLYSSLEQVTKSLGMTLTAIPQELKLNNAATQLAILSTPDLGGVNSLVLYELPSGKELFNFSATFISGPSFSPTGNLLAFQSIREKTGHTISVVDTSTALTNEIELQGSSEPVTLAAITDKGALYFISNFMSDLNPLGNNQIFGAVLNEKNLYEVVKLTRNRNNATISAPMLCQDRLTFASQGTLIDDQAADNTQYLELRFSAARQVISPITRFNSGYRLPSSGIVRSPDCKLVSWIESKKDPKTPRASQAGMQGIMFLKLPLNESQKDTKISTTSSEVALSN